MTTTTLPTPEYYQALAGRLSALADVAEDDITAARIRYLADRYLLIARIIGIRAAYSVARH